MVIFRGRNRNEEKGKKRKNKTRSSHKSVYTLYTLEGGIGMRKKEEKKGKIKLVCSPKSVYTLEGGIGMRKKEK